MRRENEITALVIRCRITRVIGTGAAGSKVPLWIASPQIIEESHAGLWRLLQGPYRSWEERTFGRRVLTLPVGSVVAATWQEAIDAAVKRTPPRPIETVYPEWCGLPVTPSPFAARSRAFPGGRLGSPDVDD